MFLLQNEKLTLADQRVKLTNEVLQGIRVVKFYGILPSCFAVVGDRLTRAETFSWLPSYRSLGE
jgi:hypothetical protein